MNFSYFKKTIIISTNILYLNVFTLQFKPGELEPVLRFGVKFEPGSDNKHLCKPTSVAVATTGEIFIADGYCNNRIIKYNAAGDLLRIIPSLPGTKKDIFHKDQVKNNSCIRGFV